MRKDLFAIRRGTAAQWTAVNPILASGEPGLETDTTKMKHGDGVTPWNLLPYLTALAAPVSGDVVIYDVDCDATVYVGAAVRMQASGVAINAKADSLANSNVLGIVQNKSTAILCDIRVSGVTPAIYGGTLDVTKSYFLDDMIDGALVEAPPVAAGHIIYELGQPFSDSRLLVSKGQRMVRT